MKAHVQITSGAKRTSGIKTLDISRGYPISKGKPNFQATSVRFEHGREGVPSIRVKVIPSNYEYKINFQQRLRENDPVACKELARLKKEYADILERGHGTLVIPKHIPVLLGQSTWLVIGGKFVVLAMRSQKVGARPGVYHMVGGVPFHTKPRRASIGLVRENVREELREEMGVNNKKISLGKPMGVHLTLEKEGVGLNVVQPVRMNMDARTFIRNTFAAIDLHDLAKGYVLKRKAKDGWEATNFVLVPNTRAGLHAFYLKNKEKLTPVLTNIFETLLREAD